VTVSVLDPRVVCLAGKRLGDDLAHLGIPHEQYMELAKYLMNIDYQAGFFGIYRLQPSCRTGRRRVKKAACAAPPVSKYLRSRSRPLFIRHVWVVVVLDE